MNNQKGKEEMQIIWMKMEINYTNEISPPRQQEELANKYAPVLYFHEDENHYPREIQEFLNDSDLKRKSWWTDPTIVSKPVSKSDLANHTADNHYLDWDGEEPDHKEYVIYSHVFTATDNKIVIQYWFFYLYNDHIFDHEGDWEMIQIICDENGNPQKAGYSQHYGGDKRSWSNVEKVDGNHPKVYVAEGGHASYFESGSTPINYPDYNLEGWDDHQGDGIVLNSSNYSIQYLTNENWLKFKGRWGEQVSVFHLAKSPEGPVFRHTKHLKPVANMWVEPFYWYSVI